MEIIRSNPGDHQMKITSQFAFIIKCTVAVAAVFCVLGTASAAVVNLGQPYAVNSTTDIYAIQGITDGNPFGTSADHVNQNFEFAGAIGNTYNTGSGLRDWGIGLVQPGGVTQSVGLNINFKGALVAANTATVTVEDFDIGSSDTFFKSVKVMPEITVYGLNNAIIATLTPNNIFSLMTAHTGGGKKSGTDVWDLNIGTLLNSINIAPDTSIAGFILSAAPSANGGSFLNPTNLVNTGSGNGGDPYLLVSVGTPTIVPEASNYLMGLAAIAILGVSHLTILRRKKAPVQGKL
jgi:hypothetical protein